MLKRYHPLHHSFLAVAMAASAFFANRFPSPRYNDTNSLSTQHESPGKRYKRLKRRGHFRTPKRLRRP